MKRNRISLTIASLALICAMTFNLVGCSMGAQAKDMMEGITPNQVNATEDLSSQNGDVTDFAIRLFKASEKSGENTLISPLSVLCALAMTANGAEGKTLEQMEALFGMTTEELNQYLYSYIKNLPQDEKYKLSLANSIWLRDAENLKVNQNFLQTNADYYGADIYKTPFNDQTCKEINKWVKDKTDGMISEILEKIPDEAIMYLINALAFEAEWSTPYEEYQVREGAFTKEDGTKQNVAFMYSEEDSYLEDEKATGFIKYYRGGKYAFVAMLPNEDISVSDYITSLDGEALNALLTNPQYTTVRTAIPKFETEYSVNMAEILKEMGMNEAFDAYNANFKKIGTSANGNIHISYVLHKTFISVGEQGTKAGAATSISMADGAATEPQEPKQVYLDRPFVYMLVDLENNIPFFIGTMMDMEK